MDTGLYHNKDGGIVHEGGGREAHSTERTKFKRTKDRGTYELEMIHGILDEGLVCHVGFSTDAGPVVIPTAYGRVGDMLYLHGSPASRMVRTLEAGLPVCVTVTLLDGLVLARSTFHHSLNYRSVIVFGTATVVAGLGEKAKALAAFVEHIVPGRNAEARAPTDKELLATTVLALPVTEASAKVRAGGPIDDAEDLDRPIWAGVVPFQTVAGDPTPDQNTPKSIGPPDYLIGYRR